VSRREPQVPRRLAEVIVIGLLCLLAVSAILAEPAKGHTTRPAWLPKVWWAIGMCETRMNWRHHAGAYEGAFGFYAGTYDTYRPAGAPRAAYLATPRQQYRAALNTARVHSLNAWGCFRNGGYRYWLGRA
jgi:hypothetical protein